MRQHAESAGEAHMSLAQERIAISNVASAQEALDSAVTRGNILKESNVEVDSDRCPPPWLGTATIPSRLYRSPRLYQTYVLMCPQLPCTTCPIPIPYLPRAGQILSSGNCLKGKRIGTDFMCILALPEPSHVSSAYGYRNGSMFWTGSLRGLTYLSSIQKI